MDYLEEMRTAEAKLDAAIAEYNAASKSKDYAVRDECDEDCEKAKKAYNDASRMGFYALCFAAPDPLYKACEVLQYQTIRYADKRQKDSKLVTREKAYSQTIVNLSDLRKYAEENLDKKIGANEKWYLMIEKFAQLLTFYACQEIGYKPDEVKQIADTYAIRKIAQEINMGKTPTSKTQIQKTLQTVVTAMLGESMMRTDAEAGKEIEFKFNATSHDAAYIRLLFAKKSRKALSMVAASAKEMGVLIAQVCHRIITEADYRVEYKLAKAE